MNPADAHTRVLALGVDPGRLAELCQRYRVRELAVFGSAARGEQGADSDIDLLVEFEPEARIGFMAFARLRIELEELLHKPVDLVSKRGLKPLIRQQVIDSSIALYQSIVVHMPSTRLRHPDDVRDFMMTVGRDPSDDRDE